MSDDNTDAPDAPMPTSEIELPDQKGSITVVYAGGPQLIFNTLLSAAEFEDKLYSEGDSNYIRIPVSEGNIRVINLRQVMFLDYGPLQDIDGLRKAAEEKNQSRIVKPNLSVNPNARRNH